MTDQKIPFLRQNFNIKTNVSDNTLSKTASPDAKVLFSFFFGVPGCLYLGLT